MNPAIWKAYLTLCKPRVVLLIVFTAVIGMFLSVPNVPPLGRVLFGALGIGLAAASAAAINHFLDRRSDVHMARTRGRPLPTGQLGPARVLGFAGALGLTGLGVLALRVNLLTAWLTFLSLIGYAVVYTAYLKHRTPQNIVIGGAAGAAPPVLGWCAITGEIHPYALLLFLLVFVWTPPHFWALAVAREKEYSRAAIPMLPVTHGADLTRLHILLYTILLSVASVLPWATGMSGWAYLVGVIPLDAVFLYLALLLRRTASDRVAMRTFGYSILYLTLLFVLLLADHYLPR